VVAAVIVLIPDWEVPWKGQGGVKTAVGLHHRSAGEWQDPRTIYSCGGIRFGGGGKKKER